MPDLKDLKIHCFHNNSVQQVQCKEPSCEWPPYRETLNYSIASAMEHTHLTGHDVWFKIFDHYVLRSAESEYIAPTIEQLAKSRGIEISSPQSPSLVEHHEHRVNWTQRTRLIIARDDDDESAKEKAIEVLIEIARAANLHEVAKTCSHVLKQEK